LDSFKRFEGDEEMGMSEEKQGLAGKEGHVLCINDDSSIVLWIDGQKIDLPYESVEEQIN
jgi:hypothetical protein